MFVLNVLIGISLKLHSIGSRRETSSSMSVWEFYRQGNQRLGLAWDHTVRRVEWDVDSDLLTLAFPRLWPHHSRVGDFKSLSILSS